MRRNLTMLVCPTPPHEMGIAFVYKEKEKQHKLFLCLSIIASPVSMPESPSLNC